MDIVADADSHIEASSEERPIPTADQGSSPARDPLGDVELVDPHLGEVTGGFRIMLR